MFLPLQFRWQRSVACLFVAYSSFSIAEESIQPVEQAVQCFPISKLSIEGASLLPKSTRNELAANIENSCVNLDDINTTLSMVSNWYQSKGYVTTRAYLPQQYLSSGELTLSVIEGVIESISATADTDVQIFNSFPLLTNKTLNLRDIEQGIDQLNRLSSNQTWMELSPGLKPGGSQINIYNDRSKAWSASLRVDNSGSEATGLYQARLAASTDNLLKTNEYLSISYQSDLEQNRSGKLSESGSLHADIPFGYWLLALDINANQYNNRINGENQTFETSGDGNSETVAVSNVVYRSQARKTEILSSLTRKESRNFIEDVLLDTSSRTTAVGKLTLRHQEILPGSQTVNIQVDLSKGLDLFGSPQKSQIDNSPEPLFTAYLANITYNKSFQWLTVNHSLQSSFNMQLSEDILFGSEQFSIGGLYSVRGYKGESVAGRKGAYLRNDLTSYFTIPQNVIKLSSISTTVGWDIGGLWDSPTSLGNEEVLQGISVGFRLSGKYLSAETTMTRALSRPEHFGNDLNQFHFAVTAKL